MAFISVILNSRFVDVAVVMVTRYQRAELLSLRHHNNDVRISRDVRKTLFALYLWLPLNDRIISRRQSINSVSASDIQPLQQSVTVSSDVTRIPVLLSQRLQTHKHCVIREDRAPVLTAINAVQQCVPTVFTANIRGGFMKKADELESVLLANNVDIACVTETWLKDVIPSGVVSISGYVIHRNDRSDGRRGGGVAVFVRQDIPCERLTALPSTTRRRLMTR